jgi:pimeloyl-ACP methyl ester carboxylesterase
VLGGQKPPQGQDHQDFGRFSVGGIARTDVSFVSGGPRCAAWLYRPSGPGPHPVVLLAHGFAFTREARLDAYAERFVDAGLAALVFDYRHFGGSDGQPRQLMDIARQLDDWRAAVSYIRSLDGIDPDRVALWGTSFSGGHVAALAAADPRVAAVISQVPYSGLGGRGRLPRPVFLVRMFAAAVRDEVCDRLGRAPAYLPLVAEPGSGVFAPFVERGATAALLDLFPPGYEWPNQFTPRVMLRLPGYRPFANADRIGCPWLVLVCDDDTITPPDRAAARASCAPRMELHRFPVGHFEVYLGEWFERAVAVQTEFLRRHLLT